MVTPKVALPPKPATAIPAKPAPINVLKKLAPVAPAAAPVVRAVAVAAAPVVVKKTASAVRPAVVAPVRDMPHQRRAEKAARQNEADRQLAGHSHRGGVRLRLHRRNVASIGRDDRHAAPRRGARACRGGIGPAESFL